MYCKLDRWNNWRDEAIKLSKTVFKWFNTNLCIFETEQKYVYQIVLDKQTEKPKFNFGGIVTTADKKIVFPKCHVTNWSYKLLTIVEIINIAKKNLSHDQTTWQI